MGIMKGFRNLKFRTDSVVKQKIFGGFLNVSGKIYVFGSKFNFEVMAKGIGNCEDKART